MLLSWYYKAFGFLNILRLLPLNIVFLVVEVFSFVLRYFCKRCVFIHLLYLSLVCLFWVCWVRVNFSGGPGHIFSVWDSAVWSAGPVQFYLGTILEWMTGLYRFFLLWFCCSGYGTGEMVGGVVCLSFRFLSLL
jgi:hypothetical protein